MSSGRVLLCCASLGALALAAKSLGGAPPPLWVAWVATFGYVAVVLVGAVWPTLEMFGDVVSRGPERGGEVALTFDDGPSPEGTRRVLDALAAARQRATFFVIGANAALYPELVREIARRGHRLGVHSWSHGYLYALLPPRVVRDDLERCAALLEELTGRRPTAFRPPIGVASPRTFAGARAAGMAVVGWSVRAFDGVRRANADAVAQRVVRGLRAGAIIALHDGDERGGSHVPAGVAALPAVLAELERRGLRSVPVEELLGDEPLDDEPLGDEPLGDEPPREGPR